MRNSSNIFLPLFVTPVMVDGTNVVSARCWAAGEIGEIAGGIGLELELPEEEEPLQGLRICSA